MLIESIIMISLYSLFRSLLVEQLMFTTHADVDVSQCHHILVTFNPFCFAPVTWNLIARPQLKGLLGETYHQDTMPYSGEGPCICLVAQTARLQGFDCQLDILPGASQLYKPYLPPEARSLCAAARRPF